MRNCMMDGVSLWCGEFEEDASLGGLGMLDSGALASVEVNNCVREHLDRPICQMTSSMLYSICDVSVWQICRVS